MRAAVSICLIHLMQAVVEKASIDELYIDVTSMVEAELRSSAGGDRPGDGPGGTAGFGWGGIVVNGPLRVDSEFEQRLSVGAMIACRLRGAVREQLGEPRRCCVLFRILSTIQEHSTSWCHACMLVQKLDHVSDEI